ncbi:hypothetical protein PFLUV_G00177180 [Perca fluviatilis]|uniref:Uncharacterized protein n=1 Tax=Perca fluviatilis TaxID=8168 RepID=A0A6A5DWI7_PERFL|nr:hypothetical protein PFLUV_G00177180 [Perca fluviatilis]
MVVSFRGFEKVPANTNNANFKRESHFGTTALHNLRGEESYTGGWKCLHNKTYSLCGFCYFSMSLGEK